MLGSECSSCCCADLFGREQLYLTVACNDIWFHYKRTITQSTGTNNNCTVGNKITGTDFFPGDSYAGTFALQRTGFRRRWQYFYPVAAPLCSDAITCQAGFIITQPDPPFTTCQIQLQFCFIEHYDCTNFDSQKPARASFNCTRINQSNTCGPTRVQRQFFERVSRDVMVDLNTQQAGIQLLWSGNLTAPTSGGCSFLGVQLGPQDVLESTDSRTVSISITL